MTRVVIADDHALVRQALRRVLEAHDIEVVGEVEEGTRVADVVAAAGADVLVLDLSLPGLHGLDVLRQVVRRSPKTRVLVLSGDGREEFVRRAIRGGASGYLLKGAQLTELLTALETLARGGRYLSPALSDHLVEALMGAAPDVDDLHDTLSDREREVFYLMAEGLSNPDIGTRLFLSPRTIETHRANIMRKLHLRNQTDVVRYAMRRGLLPPSS